MTKEPATPRYWIELPIRPLLLVLAALAAALIATHLALQTWRFSGRDVPFELYLVFDVDEEPTPWTWLSTTVLFFCSLLLAAVAGESRRARDAETLYWYGLAAGFAAMSLDEVAALHEWMNTFSTVDWTRPAVVVVLALGIAYFPFIRRLAPATRRRCLLAAAVYLAGVLGVEAIAGDRRLFPYPIDSIQYHWMSALEESVEMTGKLLFLRALLLHMRAASAGRAVSVELAVKGAGETEG
jgi:hypothetical protein